MPARIRFTPNEPQTFKLVDPSGDYDFEIQQGMYRTTDGRELVLPRQAVIRLNELGPQPGEEIGICKYVKGKEATWAVWLAASSEIDRARAEEEPSELTEQLQASIEKVNGSKPATKPVTPIRKPSRRAPDPQLQPRLFDRRGTGTDGPAPLPLIPAASGPTRRDRPAPIPWNVAFREVSAWVSKELAANSLQWSDQAQQAMVCTVLIAEAKAGRVTVWERAE